MFNFFFLFLVFFLPPPQFSCFLFIVRRGVTNGSAKHFYLISFSLYFEGRKKRIVQKKSFFSLLYPFETKIKNVSLPTLLLKQNVLCLPRKNINPYFLPYTSKYFPPKRLFPKWFSLWGTKGPYPEKTRPDKKTRNLSLKKYNKNLFPKGYGKNLSPKG